MNKLQWWQAKARFASPRAHHLLGLALIQLGQWEDAQKALENAANFSPDDASILASLKQVHTQLGNNESAQSCDDRMVKLRLVNAIEKEKQLESLREGVASRPSNATPSARQINRPPPRKPTR